MTQKLNVIYITGLGDRGDNPQRQRTAVGWWRLYGVKPHFFQVNWGDKQPWEPKYKRLLEMIDEIHSTNQKVALVGVSAGASAAINAYAACKDKVAGVVLICGWVNRPQDVSTYHDKHNPAFVGSAKQAPRSLAQLSEQDRQKILSRYAFKDELVTAVHSKIEGAHNSRLHTVGHAVTIAIQITIGAPGLLRFLKKHSANTI